MDFKSTLFVFAFATSFIMAAVSGNPMVPAPASLSSCSGMDSLESQVEICARNVPADQFADPSWQCARMVVGYVQQDGCRLETAPQHLQECLEGFGYIAPQYINPAVDCVRNSIKSGICC